jgi:tetratricopeptide (TPR) repeat protein
LPAHLLPVAYHDRGEAYQEAGQLDAAIADLTQAIRLKPDDVLSYIARAAAYDSKHQYGDAAADYSSAIHLNPRYPRSYASRYDDRIQLLQLDDAVADSTRIISRFPKEAELYVRRASAYRLQGKLDPAIADTNTALALDPDLASGFDERGLGFNAKGDFESALSDFDARIKHQSDADGYVERGIALWELGKSQDAIESFQQALKLDPAQRYAYMWLVIEGITPQLDKAAAGKLAGTESKWRGQLIQLYLQGSPQSLTDITTEKLSPRAAQMRACETDFYAGEWKLLHGDRAAGKLLLQDASKDCGPGDLHLQTSFIALKRSL